MIYYVFWRDDKLSHIVWLQWDRVDIVTICPREIHVYYVGVCVCVWYSIYGSNYGKRLFFNFVFFSALVIYTTVIVVIVSCDRYDPIAVLIFLFFPSLSLFGLILALIFFLFVSLLSFSLYCGSRKRMKKKIKQGKKIIFVVVL